MRVNRLRWRLTLYYCAAAVGSGVVLLGIIVLLSRSLPAVAVPVGRAPDRVALATLVQIDGFRSNLLLLPAVALAIMAVLSLAAGWVIAGRMLRPVRAMTGRLRHISGPNVHERLAVEGPRDEFKDLADTVDGLLGRLESALEAQKRFVANAAHELRTPLTVEHALLEEPLIDAEATVAAYRANFERLLRVNRDRGRLLESLLTLADSSHGLGRTAPLDLAAVAGPVVREGAPGLRVSASLRPATLRGDPALIARLVANLWDNAVHHNIPGGSIDVSTGTIDHRPLLLVSNTGPVVPAAEVDRLFEPFQRLRRVADDGHHGLGLSIIRAIATAHGAVVTARARRGGGLTVSVVFPAAR
ncbi:HAMP domain-containing sensor histidine kinase [Symbioplanes lichenis]|uniref:HAMP domain-containing sensor histidine kinase n=1 Tax=Symbioplanes lichenis TaxID=1629072 RepID=UPI00273975A7|nr:ATP-binding protein [Actinoplanes lichenis]